MSFVGGGAECSVNGNVISQFNKHTQQDRSLQRQVANQQGVQNQGFKQDNLMNVRDRQGMDQFMNGQGQGAFQFQPMRHELDVMQRRVHNKTLLNKLGFSLDGHKNSNRRHHLPNNMLSLSLHLLLIVSGLLNSVLRWKCNTNTNSSSSNSNMEV